MEEEKLGQKPICPSLGYGLGMSQRLFIATMAMQGFLRGDDTLIHSEDVAKLSFEYADALLRQENG